MSTQLLERRPRGAATSELVVRQRCTADSGGGLTLDELITGVWEALSAHESVRCPACGGAMAPRYAAGPPAVGGACGACGTTLS